MDTQGIRVISVMPVRQYEVITISEEFLPGASLEQRTLLLLNEMTVVFFNDGLLSFLRPN